MGLTAAINNLAEKFAARTGVELSLDMQQFIDDLVPPARTAIFRVAQEALNNVERHAKATRLQIKLWTEKDEHACRYRTTVGGSA